MYISSGERDDYNTVQHVSNSKRTHSFKLGSEYSRTEWLDRERKDHFIIPCYFIESDRARFNHGLTSSALFFPSPSQSQLDLCEVLRVIPNYFASVKRKPCVRSNSVRLLAELYGGDKRERKREGVGGDCERRSFANRTALTLRLS